MKIARILIPILALAALQLACSLPTLAGNDAAGTPAVADQLPQKADVSPTEESQAPEFCAAEGPGAPQSSGLVVSVTNARNVEGEEKNPVDATDIFAPQDVIHSVVAIVDAPAGSKFKAIWRVVDINDPDYCNTAITEFEVETEGTRNIDFNLSPDSPWPAGTYKVEIYVNGVLDTVKEYTVQ